MDLKVKTLVDAWHWSYLDVEMAFDGMSHRTLHQRPHAQVPSVAEMVAHTVYSEASIVLRYLLGIPKGQWGDDPMLREPYGWPPRILAEPSPGWLLELDPPAVKERWLAQHARFLGAMSEFALAPDHRFDDEWTEAAPDVETRLRFAAYHVAYHVAQIYSNRHFLGEETPDN